MSYMRKVLNWYSRLTPGRKKVKPPYEHVTQVGDPVLRKICKDVPETNFKSEELKTLVSKMIFVLKKYDSIGISAPQIGVNLNVFLIQFTEDQLYAYDDKTISKYHMSTIPLTVFINPSLKIVNYEKVSYLEGCVSVRGFFADVPRYKEIAVKSYNVNGEEINANYSGWSARIVQHELDHLKGKLFIDIMDRSTFQCQMWEEINKCKGKVKLSFSP